MRSAHWLAFLLIAGTAAQATHAANSGNIGRMSFSQNGRVTTLGPPTNSGGSTIPVSPSMGGWTTAGNYGVPTGATGPTAGLNVNGQFVVGGSAGVKYPVSGSYAIPWTSVATGAAALVCTIGTAGACGLAGVAAAAMPYLVDWIGRAGMSRNPATGDVEAPPDDDYPVSDGYQYRFTILGVTGQWAASRSAACYVHAANVNQRAPTYGYVSGRVELEGARCVVYMTQANGLEVQNGWSDGDQSTGGCGVGQYVTPTGCSNTGKPKRIVTQNEFATKLGNVGPDPRVFGEVMGQGGAVEFPTPSVTGPASVQGPETVKQNPDGSKEVTRTTYNFTTNNNVVTNTSNVTTTTYINASGQTTGTTTTTTTPTETQPGTQQPADQEESAPVDTPLGDLPKLYERKYPDGIVGIWTEKRQQLNQTQLFQLPQQLMPTGVGGGSCPTFTIPLDFVAFGDFGVGDVSPPCWIYDVLKVIVLIGAAILARALIFGG